MDFRFTPSLTFPYIWPLPLPRPEKAVNLEEQEAEESYRSEPVAMCAPRVTTFIFSARVKLTKLVDTYDVRIINP